MSPDVRAGREAPEAPLTKKGRATRDRIVATAAQLMFEHGVAGTSTSDVRAAAGVSMSQIYHYFDDKQELVRAVVTHQAEAVLNAQEPLLSHLDSLSALRTWRDAIVALQHARECRGGCPIGALGSELAETDAVSRQEAAAGFARWETAIARGMRLMRDRGELRAEVDPDQLALGILAALQGGLLLTQVRRDTTALEASLDTVLAYVESLLVRD